MMHATTTTLAKSCLVRFFVLILPTLLLVGCQTASRHSVNISQLVSDYYSLQPSTAVPASITMNQAQSAQKAFVQALSARSGSPVGYKVGLVTEASQKRFGANAPIRGTLLSGMIQDNNAGLPAAFGVAPVVEADLVVVVKDKGINKARNVLDVAEHLSNIVAFIELPDTILATNQPVTSSMLVAANVGARLGVLGTKRRVVATPDFLQAVANMNVTMTDQTGAVLGKAQAKTILDHPLHALLWLIEELDRAGTPLKAGDLVSLGGMIIAPAKAGQSITVTYDGLPGGPMTASVHFR